MNAFEKIKAALGFSTKSDDHTEEGWISTDFYSNVNPSTLSKADYYRFFKSWTYVAVTTISNDFASLNYNLFKSDGNTGDIVNHEYLKLITYSLMQYTAAYMKVNGNAYRKLTKVGQKIKRIDMLDPVKVKVVYNGAILTGYEYTNNGSVHKFPAEDVIPFHNMNLLQPYPSITNGMSDIEAISLAIQTDEGAALWNKTYFENGAQPQGYLFHPQELTADQRQDITNKRNNKYRGSRNANKTAVLSGGMEYKTVSVSQKDMDFVEQRRFSRDEILGIFKVPRAILGLGDNVNLNVGTFEKIYAERTLKPMAIQISDVLNQTLFKGIGFFQFINIVPLDETMVLGRYNAGVATLNETRNALGMDPLEEGDVLKTPSISLLGLSADPTENKSVDQSGSDKGFSFMKVKKVVKTIIESTDVTQESLNERIRQGVVKSIRKGIPGTEEYNEEQRNLKIQRNNDYETNYKNKLLIIFKQQEDDIINSFKNSKAKGQSVKKIEFNALKYITLYYTLLKEEQESILEKEGQIALRQVNSVDDFDISNTIEKWMSSNIKKFAKSIDGTTQEKVSKVLLDIDADGLTVEDGVKKLKTVFTELKDSRANTIVRTETIRVANFAQLQGWKQSGVVERKQWYTALDERVCPYCDSMNGKIVGLEDPFFEKGSTHEPDGASKVTYDYEDIEGAPLHPNCRCTMLPLIN